MNLDGAGSNLEAAAPGLPGKRVLDIRIVEFTDLAAGLADFEGGNPWVGLAMPRVTADDEGVLLSSLWMRPACSSFSSAR